MRRWAGKDDAAETNQPHRGSRCHKFFRCRQSWLAEEVSATAHRRQDHPTDMENAQGRDPRRWPGKATEAGTPQGSILSPLLSNIYLHHVLDLWFRHTVQPSCCGEAYSFRFADDFIACFQCRDDARRFDEQLPEWLSRFGLAVAAEKTRCIEFGRFARDSAYKRGEKPKEFTFLGFTHYCGKTKNGCFKVKRRTSRTKLGQSLRQFADWARHARPRVRKGEMLWAAKVRIMGYLNYYAITDNSEQCHRYALYATRLLFKWLNRKSQRKAYTWAGFTQALAWVGWPNPRIRKDLNPCRRAEAY